MATKKFICKVCGYIHEGDAAPEFCPLCKAPASEFEEIKKKGLFQDKNSNAYIILYSVVMVVLVATLLSVASLSLQKRQYDNMLNEKKQQIVTALGADPATTAYSDVVVEAALLDAEGNAIILFSVPPTAVLLFRFTAQVCGMRFGAMWLSLRT